MAAVVTVFDGVRVNSSDSNTNWGNWGSGGGAPSSEDQLAYQGTAVNTKHGGTALDGIDYDPGASPANMLLASRRLWFAKVIVSDSFDLNATHGVNLALGQSQSVLIEYNMAGSGAARSVYDTYPPQGGYLITAIDPRIVAYRDSTTGTTDLSAVDWWGAQCAMIVGAAKGENLALDAIDIGRGWKLTRGDSTDADGEYQDFIDDDQGSDTAVPAGRVGVITSSGPGIMTIHGLLTIGEPSTTTEFTDETGMVKLYPDGYHSAGSVGTVWNLGDASTLVTDTATEIGQGQKDADQDTRPDIIVEDTSGSATLDGKSITKARRVLYTNGVSAVGQALKACGQVDPTNSDYGGYQTLDGAGDYLATSAAVNRTFVDGDFEFIAYLKATDWSPGSTEVILDWDNGVSDDQIQLIVNSSNDLQLSIKVAAGTSTFIDTGILDNFVDGEWYWIRLVYDSGTADYYWSLDPANTPPQDIVWVAGASPTNTARAVTALTSIIYIGAISGGASGEWTGDIAYASLWDQTVASEQQVFMADWRTGVDFTGGTPARPDGIQSVNWEENGNPVYTQGDDNTTAADLDGTSIADTTSYAALRWDVNADPDGELDNMVFDKGTGTSHAIEFGKNTPSSVTLRGQTYTGYNAANGNADSTFYNNTGGALTINLVGFTGNASYRNGVGATTTLVPNPVTLQLTAQDQGGTAIQSARVVVRAGSTGPLPYLDSVTITQTGGTATVSHTGHGLSTSDKVVIEGATNGNTREYNGIKTITVTGVDAYTYAIDSGTPSPATGTITSTAVIIDELTTAGGIADDTRSYSADQQIDPLRSYVRKSSSADDPKYRTSPVSGTIDKDTGLSLNILMIPDQ